MTTKTTGIEFKRFYAEPWPDGQYHEDVEITINGDVVDEWDIDGIQATDSVVISGGMVINDGVGLHLALLSHISKNGAKNKQPGC